MSIVQMDQNLILENLVSDQAQVRKSDQVSASKVKLNESSLREITSESKDVDLRDLDRHSVNVPFYVAGPSVNKGFRTKS